MKPLVFFLIVTCLFMLLYSQPIWAQEESRVEQVFRVTTLDGNEFIGKIIHEDDESLTLRIGDFTKAIIQKHSIESIVLLTYRSLVDGVPWFDNFQATRYFFSPNGFALDKGESYYQNAWILLNQATFGVSDNISVSTGIIPLFLLGGSSTPVWLNVKASIPVVEDKHHIGVGALVGAVVDRKSTGFGVLYAVNTFGNKDQNINVGLGWAFSGKSSISHPIISLGGMYRTGPKGYFITENYFIPSPDIHTAIISVGGRRFINRVGLDYGFIIPIASLGGFLAIPWLGMTIPF
ncbi:hypothetical protein [Pararhodonellum marinum]|uniref:hypothetical protein n=1 Tax=Pararhodonellum marinum TaxID=2755358 RepID=UPI001890490F|nr:hypothetical protein [Pararhodonellum marinum]